MAIQRYLAAIVLLWASVTIAGSRTAELLPAQDELFRAALEEAGLAMEDVRIDTGDLALWGGGKYTPPLVKTFFDCPWKISGYTSTLTDGMLNKDQDIPSLIGSAHKRTGHGVRLGLIGDPLADYRARVEELGFDALSVALSELTGEPPSRYMGSNPEGNPYNEMDERVRTAVAQFVFCLPDVLEFREQGLVEPLAGLGIDPAMAEREVLDFLLATEGEGDEDDWNTQRSLLIESMLDNVDWYLLNAGATLLSIAAVDLEKQLQEISEAGLPDDPAYIVMTTLGLIIIDPSRRGVAPGAFSGNFLLFVDLWGDTVYDSVCGTNSENPVSVCIDLAGNDRWDCEPRPDTCAPSLGAGLFGYAILIDSEGDDTYRAADTSIGCGIFGTGVLWDKAGDDDYFGGTLCQGAGAFGCGLLIDNDGNDEYELFNYGQGYGFTLGCGLLLDGDGSDNYIALETGPPNGGPFGEERYIHFAQGAAYGRRADYTDGHSWAGGTGILLDGGGDDEYHCEVYGQGTGYWYGIGMCVDKGGDDYHHAGWYSLGGSPHFAVGIFQDNAGDDFYALKQMQSMGNGRDFSIGWFEDRAGDDWYQGNIMTLGVGDVNGIGVFWDWDGNDTYIAKGPSLGQSRIAGAGGLRDYMLTLGLFVDGGGDDAYFRLEGEETPTGQYNSIVEDISVLKPLDFPRNNTTWTRETDGNEVIGAYGVGIDGE